LEAHSKLRWCTVYLTSTRATGLAQDGLIKHNTNPVKLDDINDNLQALGRGGVAGRLVIVYE
jgi:alcohol dehydrogenase, propanol-preferring